MIQFPIPASRYLPTHKVAALYICLVLATVWQIMSRPNTWYETIQLMHYGTVRIWVQAHQLSYIAGARSESVSVSVIYEGSTDPESMQVRPWPLSIIGAVVGVGFGNQEFVIYTKQSRITVSHKTVPAGIKWHGNQPVGPIAHLNKPPTILLSSLSDHFEYILVVLYSKWTDWSNHSCSRLKCFCFCFW